MNRTFLIGSSFRMKSHPFRNYWAEEPRYITHTLRNLGDESEIEARITSLNACSPIKDTARCAEKADFASSGLRTSSPLNTLVATRGLRSVSTGADRTLQAWANLFE